MGYSNEGAGLHGWPGIDFRDDYKRLLQVEAMLNKRNLQVKKLAAALSEASAAMMKALTNGSGVSVYHYETGVRDGLKRALEITGAEPEKEDDGLPF